MSSTLCERFPELPSVEEGGTPSEFAAFIKVEAAKWAKFAKIQLD